MQSARIPPPKPPSMYGTLALLALYRTLVIVRYFIHPQQNVRLILLYRCQCSARGMCTRQLISYGGRRYSLQGLARKATAACSTLIRTSGRKIYQEKTYTKDCHTPYDGSIFGGREGLVSGTDQSLVGATGHSLWWHDCEMCVLSL